MKCLQQKLTSTILISVYNKCYEWLMCYLMSSISTELNCAKDQGLHFTEAKNRTQVYRASVLVKAYGEYNALKAFQSKLEKTDLDSEIKSCLLTVYFIYAQWSLEKHLVYFFEGSFTQGPPMVTALRNQLLSHCHDMKKYAVTVADALSPPDFILNSVIAKADGKLYQNLQTEFMTNPGALERATWWQNVLPVRKAKL